MHVQIGAHREKGRCGVTGCKHAGPAHVARGFASVFGAGAAARPLGSPPTRPPVRPPPRAPALLQLRLLAVPPHCVPQAPRPALAAPRRQRPPQQPPRRPLCASGDQDDDLQMPTAFQQAHRLQKQFSIVPVPVAGRLITACNEVKFLHTDSATQAGYHMAVYIQADRAMPSIGCIERCWHPRGQPSGSRSRRCRQLCTARPDTEADEGLLSPSCNAIGWRSTPALSITIAKQLSA